MNTPERYIVRRLRGVIKDMQTTRKLTVENEVTDIHASCEWYRQRFKDLEKRLRSITKDFCSLSDIEDE